MSYSVRSIDNKAVGNRIRSIRLEKGQTMEEFGELLATSKGTVNNWEKGRNLPNKENLKAIAKIGDITVNELLYGTIDDYAKVLLENLKNDLHKDDSIKKGVIPLIVDDVENRLFPKYFSHGFDNIETLEKAFIKYKDDAIELWTNYDILTFNLLLRIGRQLSSTINDNLKYFYSDFYKNEDHSIHPGEKISSDAQVIIKELQNLDNEIREKIDDIRLLVKPIIKNDEEQ